MFSTLSAAEQNEILQLQQAILKSIALGTEHMEVINEICRLEEKLLPNAVASIMLMDEDYEFLNVYAAPSVPSEGIAQLNNLRPGPGGGSCGNVIYQQAPQFVSNTFTDPRWADLRQLAYNFNLCSCWSVPIYSAENKIIGTFALSSFEHRSPSPFHKQLLEIGSSIAGIVLGHRKAEEELRLAHAVYQNSSEAILVTDTQNRILAINPAFTQMTGYTQEEALNKNPKMLSSGRQDEAFYRDMWHAIDTTGQWQGEIWNRRKNGEEYAEWLTINTIYSEDGSVHRRVALFSDITEKKKADALIWTQANYDLLTRLPNRRLLTDRLDLEIKKAHRDHHLFALLFLDLDRFKEVNDSLGHHMGDQLLIEAAKRIEHCVRESDTVARFGGDEFTIILSDINNPSDIGRIAQDILDALVEPFNLGEEQAFVSASIGITVYPDDADNVAGLLKNADQAMYAAKKDGRNRFSCFTKGMQDAAQIRMCLARDMRSALAQDQFLVHYQPIVDLTSGRIHKAEALLRWNYPGHGFISPAAFIPIAEETGAIHDIGDWVFKQAAQQVKKWQAVAGGDFQISVNKSPVQFRDMGIVHDHWEEYLQAIGLSGNSIVVEITEGLLLNADRSVTDKLLHFRDTGMQVAIDDFGTGYSALAYLKKFDIDYLKIDQSFVRNLAPDNEDMALCEAMIVMAHKLDLKVIAEGVETNAQYDLLVKIGCDYAQGYLFSKPVPAEEFELLLKRH